MVACTTGGDVTATAFVAIGISGGKATVTAVVGRRGADLRRR